MLSGLALLDAAGDGEPWSVGVTAGEGVCTGTEGNGGANGPLTAGAAVSAGWASRAAALGNAGRLICLSVGPWAVLSGKPKAMRIWL